MGPGLRRDDGDGEASLLAFPTPAHADPVEARTTVRACSDRLGVSGLVDRHDRLVEDGPTIGKSVRRLDASFHRRHIYGVACDVEYTDEFGVWWDGLSEREQVDVRSVVKLLEEHDVRLAFPYSSSINGSRHRHMRELRVQSGGRPIRVFYAFDPVRNAILLIGGDKTGDGRFYEVFVPIADRLYDDHLTTLGREGLL